MVEEEEENDSWSTGWIFRFHGLVLIHVYQKYAMFQPALMKKGPVGPLES